MGLRACPIELRPQESVAISIPLSITGRFPTKKRRINETLLVRCRSSDYLSSTNLEGTLNFITLLKTPALFKQEHQ